MNKIKKIINSRVYRLSCFMCSMIAGIWANLSVCFANADDVAKTVVGPMNSLLSVILTVMAVVGVFMLVKSITELVNAIQEQNNSGIFHAGRGMAAALLMIAIKFIIKLFGYDL